MVALLERPPETPPAPAPGHVGLLARLRPTRIVVGVVALLVMALVLAPIGTMISRVFYDGERFTTEVLTTTLGDPALWTVVGNTITTAGVGAVLAFVVGSTFAWLNERTDARVGWVSDLLPIAPLMIPSVAVGIGWVFLLSPTTGFLNVVLRDALAVFGVELATGPLDIFSRTGLILVYCYAMVPYAYIAMSAGLRNVDSALEEAARIAGRSAWNTFRTVTLPAIKPSIATAGFLLTVSSLTLFSVPVIIGTGAGVTVLSVAIVRTVGFSYPPRINEAIVQGFLILVVVAFVWLVQSRIAARGRFATISGKGSARVRVRLGAWRYVAFVAMGLYLVAVTLLPLAALVLVSLQHYWTADLSWTNLTLDNYVSVLVDNALVAESLYRSVYLGVFTATFLILLCGVLQWFVRETGGVRGRILDGVCKLPAGVSSLVIAIGFILVFTGSPWWLAGTVTILFLAYLVIHMPEASFLTGTALRQVGTELSEASYVSGAGAAGTLRRVLLPLMRPGLAAAWALVFVLVSCELTASAMLSGPSGNAVAGYQIMYLYDFGLFPVLAALSTVMTVLSTTVVAVVLLGFGRQGRFRLARH